MTLHDHSHFFPDSTFAIGAWPSVQITGDDAAMDAGAGGGFDDSAASNEMDILESGTDPAAGNDAENVGTQDAQAGVTRNQVAQDAAAEISDQDQPATPPDTETDTEAAPEATDETVQAAPEPEPAPAPDSEAAKRQAEIDKALNETYKSHPELKEFLSRNPQLKPAWFKASEMNKLYPTVDDARRAKEWASQLAEFDSLFFSENPADTDAFLDQLWRNSLRNPDMPFHPTENPSSGAYERLSRQVITGALEQLGAQLDKVAAEAGWNPQQARYALDGIAKLLGLNLKSATPAFPTSDFAATGQSGTDPRELALAQREAALAQREAAIRKQLDTEFYSSLQSGLTNFLQAEIERALKPAMPVLAKQPKGVQTYVRKEIQSRVEDAVKEDAFFEKQLEAELRRGDRGPDHRERLLTMIKQRAQHYFADIARDVLADVGYQAVAQQKVITERQTQAARRREPVSSASPGRLTGGPAVNRSGKTAKYTGNYDKDADRILGL